MILDYPGYLVHAANQMTNLYLDGDLNSFTKAAQVGCITLRALAKDQQFFNAVREIDEQASLGVLVDVFKSQNELVNFLSCERQLFLHANLHSEVVELLDKHIRILIEENSTPDKAIQIRRTITPRNMHLFVERIRDQACELSKMAVESAQKDALKQLFANLIVGIGSISCAALNSSPAVQLLGIGALTSQLSTILGSAVLGEAISNIHENLQIIKNVNAGKNTNLQLRR